MSARNEMTYNYSQLSAESVLRLVKEHYDIVAPASCKFYVLGLHDNYLLERGQARYIFRVYRNEWRTEEEIQFELALLNYCKKQKLNVSAAVPCGNGESTIDIGYPEGRRTGVLFEYAEGRSIIDDVSLKNIELLGASVANFHVRTRDFKTSYKRPTFNLQFLFDRSLKLIEPFIRSDQRRYLLVLRARIQAAFSALSDDGSDYGICTGDINISNFHVNEAGEITHFDFDQCGFGYRAFELGKFVSSLPNNSEKKEKVTAFLRAYETVRPISDAERNAIPYFELASLLWVMSIHAANANRIGHKYLEEGFWLNRVDLIRSLEKELT